jgi:signal transduction histidine kinase
VVPFLSRRWVDVLVVVLAALAVGEAVAHPPPAGRAVAVAGALLWTLPLLARRRFPLAAPAVVFVVLAVESLLSGSVVTSSSVNPFALLAAFAIIGAHPDQRAALIGGGIGYGALATIVLMDIADADSIVVLFVLSGAAWALGRVLAERGRRTEELRQRAERLEREQETAALSERARIARELHDVIAHSLSVMTIQAGAARLLLDEDPSRAREPLVAVEETGHQALGEMRRLLGVLRGTGDEATLAPQPGMRGLDELVGNVRAAGLPVDVELEGPARPLAPALDLTAYRIVQEALTNVLRHAGAARARVRVRYLADAVELDVTNTGHVATVRPGGHGLVGMRQRVDLYGGELEAGPHPGGGYAVHVRLPDGGSPS